MLIGLVGKPNVGKSTFFKAATLAEVAIASYPFTTIEANQGVGFVKVKCPEAKQELAEKLGGKNCNPKHGFCLGGERFVPVKLTDVAGLVPEAHLGKGRGNQFLDDLREADVLIHLIDASGKTDEEGNPTENHDITKDILFLEKEINIWIFQILKRNWSSLIRKSKTKGNKISKEISNQLTGLKIKEEQVSDIIKKLGLNDKGNWKDEQILEFSREIRKKSKPIIIAANKADRKEAKENIKMLKEKFPELLIIPCSAESELALREAAKSNIIKYIPGDKSFELTELAQVNEEQKNALNIIKEKVLEIYDSTGIQQCLNEAVFSFLKFITIYPVENENHLSDSQGNILPDALLLPPDSTAPDLAYAVHTDIGNSFIGAINCKTGVRIGKESVLKDGDVVKILTR